MSARVGGQLHCTEASFTNPEGEALNADGLTVDADHVPGPGAVHRRGPPAGARIGGRLNCSGASFTNPEATALNADGLSVDGNMPGPGAVHRASCAWGALTSAASWTARGPASPTPRARPSPPTGCPSTASMSLHQGECTGEVQPVGAHIGGQLDCSGASFTNPGAGPERRWVGRRGQHVPEPGAVHRRGPPDRCSYRRRAGLLGGQLHPPRGPGPVDLERVTVDAGRLHAPGRVEGRARPHQRSSRGLVRRAEDLAVRPEAPAEGFVYDRIDAPDATVKDRLRRLATQQPVICLSPTSSWPGSTGKRATSRPSRP